ncbi:hypothetical protein [Polaribacter sp. Z022]|uniref:hypothetical protein n=1 Tax=Polaribacter sp. Z022 TaxID=2927125 RepID=UPI00201FF08A|nr:hypothetical protein [Polaribacter sp. Z022]MCL7753093.1 hypothetical protein [Polaribacter sp. Z022]
MKYKIIFLLVFFNAVNLFCQQNKWSVNLEGISTTKGLFNYSSVGYDVNNLKFQAGILLGKEYVNNETVLGSQLDIIYFPNKKRNDAFNLLFIGSINYFRNTVLLNFSKVTTNFIQGTLGYGFIYSISEKLNFKSNIGLGILLEKRVFNFDTNDPNNKWGFGGIVSMGVTYKL